ncbi:MAG: hypothetical protein VX733_15540 [Candidatus Latescibacterota bacterium]|nr:hypothetical protein [Candidatus Latescibacterota bacterium]
MASDLFPRIANDPRTIELAQILLRSELPNLRLQEQVIVRSDTTPPPHGPANWHIDFPFTDEENESTPRRIFIQMVHY